MISVLTHFFFHFVLFNFHEFVYLLEFQLGWYSTLVFSGLIEHRVLFKCSYHFSTCFVSLYVIKVTWPVEKKMDYLVFGWNVLWMSVRTFWFMALCNSSIFLLNFSLDGLSFGENWVWSHPLSLCESQGMILGAVVFPLELGCSCVWWIKCLEL